MGEPAAGRPMFTSFNGARLPQWAQVATVVGVPSLIALFLVWFGASRVDGNLSAVGDTLRDNETRIERLLDLQLRHNADAARSSRDMYRLLQRICINTAETENQREACLR